MADQLAVSLTDLEKIPSVIRAIMLKDGLSREVVRVGDDDAVIFSCDLLQAACICDIIRKRDVTAGDKPARVYLKRQEKWHRLSAAAVLTEYENDKLILSPSVFKVAVERAPRSAPQPKRVEL